MSTANIHAEKILILDFGSQYTQLIARRVREIGVYCEIWPWDVDSQLIADFKAAGVILSGGPETVTVADAPAAPQLLWQLGIPILGICYGMQAMAVQLGGAVESHAEKEFGYAEVSLDKPGSLLPVSTNGKLDVWMSHGDRVSQLPAGFELLCSSDSAPIAGMADESRNFYGLQFHPEVTHTKQGLAILRNFLQVICRLECLWTTANIIADDLQLIRNQVGQQKVLLGLSGGVDSSVVAALLHEAIDDQLTCVFVDTGLLRFQEAEQVMATFANNMGVKVIKVEARQRYLDALAGVSDPEQKRKIIGRLFIKIFEEQATALKDVRFLAQGTIYPDVIESAASKTGKAQVIKSHHNVGGLPEQMQLELVEPLRELFKDEVRKVGLAMGLPKEMVYRHPFPGPGLGVRILGEVKEAYLEPLARADHIFIEELRKHDLYEQVSQAFAVFLPIRSVGVVGDARRYEWVIALRAVETIDFMTARWADLPYDFLDLVSRRIINEIADISRVVYDISGKPPATIEWE